MDSHGNLRGGTDTRVNLEEPCDIIKNSKGVVEGLQCETLTRAHSNPSYSFGDSATICDGAELFCVSLSTPKDIDTFTSDLESSKYRVWSELTREKRQDVMNTIWSVWNKLVAKNPIEMDVSKVSSSDPIVQAVDINTKSTSYARAAGASAKELPKVNSNFRPLVANPVFDGVNISILCKVVEKVSTRFEHTLYGYFIGKRIAFPVVEYYARINLAKRGLKRIMMNNKGFFFFKFISRVSLEVVLKGGTWVIRKSPIILKNWSIDTRLLKEELTRIPI
ncbi:zinc knuckle CX2CX4HX4C containing protein [Tanacetum coccineum]|uniref:Zinc knuckle CX2CX4HX4C containing protein n=1 Tax=Tanacetum coccineum TaxID=301880 RepID=A0ABQ5A1V6_9ASTR